MLKLFNKKANQNLTKSQLETLEKVLNWSKDYFNNANKTNQIEFGGHDFDHAVRVAGYAHYISQRENVSPFLPILAGLLHDTGRVSKDSRAHGELHGQLSKEIIRDFIHSLGLSDQDINLILNAIEDHPFLNSKVRESYLVKILMDADRLDAFGRVGIIRSAANRWKNFSCLFEDTKLNPLDKQTKTAYEDISIRIMGWYKIFWTKSAKKIAKPRYKFLNDYCKKFDEEIEFCEKQLDGIGL